MQEVDKAIALTLPDEKFEVPEGHPILNKEVMKRFEELADGYRETLRKTKRDAAERRKDEAGIIEADSLALPGDSINPYTYVKYAFDKDGNLSIGRKVGRIKPHRNALTRLLSQRTQALIVERMAALKSKAEVEKREPTPAEYMEVLTTSLKHARNRTQRQIDARKKKRRNQQKLSRRINRGLAKGRKFNRSTR